MTRPTSAILPVREVEKPWGCDTLPEPFAASPGRRMGEIWFEPPPGLPQLLVKYIFTSEALSVQVHPSDAETVAQGLGKQGKEECWLILDAAPDAVLGIGFKRPVTPDQMRTAALDGSIEGLMQWHEVRAGDFFYIPAGTVHAISAGISLIEVQQNSDITYRLYDYGRRRELHLDEAVAVASGQPYPVQNRLHVPDGGSLTLVEGPLFRLDQVAGLPSEDVAARYGAGPLLVIPRHGEARIGAETIGAGQCGLAQGFDQVAFDQSGVSLIAQPTV